MNIEPFTVDHYIRMLGDKSTQEGLNAACLNQIAGPAFTLFDGKRILAIGGVQVQGIGQAWTMLSDEGRQHPFSIVKAGRAILEESIVRERLYRLFAYASPGIGPKWFKAMGFRPDENICVR